MTDPAQDVVHRVQSEEQVRAVTEMARELGWQSVNMTHFWFALQTTASVAATMEG